MLSKQSKYAIRGVLYLAIYANEKNKLGSTEVGAQANIPAPFLAKIFQKLSRENLIISMKGPNGGFYLSEKELSNSLLDIIECIDGLETFNTCFIGLPHCSDNNPCSIHHLAAPWRDQLVAELKVKTIAEMAEDVKSGNSRIF
jgi:Rrf2 family protein